jgi:hypothetical protein
MHGRTEMFKSDLTVTTVHRLDSYRTEDDDMVRLTLIFLKFQLKYIPVD